MTIATWNGKFKCYEMIETIYKGEELKVEIESKNGNSPIFYGRPWGTRLTNTYRKSCDWKKFLSPAEKAQKEAIARRKQREKEKLKRDKQAERARLENNGD